MVGDIVGAAVGNTVGDVLGGTTVTGYIFLNFQEKRYFGINFEN